MLLSPCWVWLALCHESFQKAALSGLALNRRYFGNMQLLTMRLCYWSSLVFLSESAKIEMPIHTRPVSHANCFP
jgi:hypothetical protein